MPRRFLQVFLLLLGAGIVEGLFLYFNRISLTWLLAYLGILLVLMGLAWYFNRRARSQIARKRVYVGFMAAVWLSFMLLTDVLFAEPFTLRNLLGTLVETLVFSSAMWWVFREAPPAKTESADQAEQPSPEQEPPLP